MKTEEQKEKEKTAQRRKYLEGISVGVEKENTPKGNELKREDFVRLRINSIEKERLSKIEKLTGRKRSDIVREAMYRFIKSDYPEFF